MVKRARRLRSRKGRQAEGAFLAEGLRVVLTAIEHQAPIQCVLCCPELLASPAANAALEVLAARGVPLHALSKDLFERISGRDNPTGLAAVVGANVRAMADLPSVGGGIYVALDRVADPGNLGTVLRTLDAVGAAGLVLAGGGTDPFHPTAVRASLGSLWTVPWAAAPSLVEVVAWARERGLAVAATSARGEVDYWAAAYPGSVLLLMGSERDGLPAASMAAADLRLTVPMWGTVSSLNLAVATALVVYEVRRRHEGASGGADAADMEVRGLVED